jgi:hypothetical protein
MRARYGLLVLASMVVSSWATAAEVCRQVDERGRTQFIDCRHARQGAEQVDATLPETGANISTEKQKERFRSGLPPAATDAAADADGKQGAQDATSRGGKEVLKFRNDREFNAWVAEQEKKCAADTAAALKKMRDVRIELCIQEQERSESECRRYYADFGMRGRGDGTSKRLYDQPASCRQLDEARRQRNRGG